VKVVPRFFPFFVAPPVTPALESARGGGVPEILDPSSTGTELLIPFLIAVVPRTGIATGPVGAREKVAETSGPGGDTDEDIVKEARELRVVVAVGNTTGLRTGVSTERKNIQAFHSQRTVCGVACVAESPTHLSRRREATMFCPIMDSHSLAGVTRVMGGFNARTTP